MTSISESGAGEREKAAARVGYGTGQNSNIFGVDLMNLFLATRRSDNLQRTLSVQVFEI